MKGKCPNCVGKQFCTCKKLRQKDKPAEPYWSKRRDTVRTHNWTPWVRSRVDNPERGEPSLPGDHLVKMCQRCGRVRARKA